MAARLQVVASASTAQAGPLFPMSWTEVYKVLTTSLTRGEDLLNPAFTKAIQDTPEGGLLELSMSGMPTLPVVGVTGQVVADRLNTEWAAGRLRYAEGPAKGQRIELWPRSDGGPGKLAVYDPTTRTVTVRCVKRQPPILIIILVILGILVALAIADAVLGTVGKQITFHGLVPTVVPKPPTPPPGSVASWWDNLSFLDKALILGGGLGLVGFGVWVWGEEKIHAAGANRSSINIYEGSPDTTFPVTEGGSS
jgi:hypothetical protein